LRKSEVEKKKGLEKIVKRDPITEEKGRREEKNIAERKDPTHQATSHSARYSTPMTHASTDQYINHRSRSSSDAGRWDKVLNEA
jgi:hypothetical protein